MVVRLCHPFDFAQLISYDPHANAFEQPLGELVNDAILWLTKAAMRSVSNITIIIHPHHGIGSFDEDNGRYDGCLGRLQTNQSDLMLQMAKYPMPGDNLTQGLILYDTFMTISGAYQMTEPSRTAQITESFLSFSWQLWLLCFFTLLTLCSLLWLREGLRLKPRSRRIRRNNYSFYHVSCHCARINQIPDRGLLRKIIFFCASLFSLVVVHYFLTLIKTDLVVVKRPQVFDSYADVVERDVNPLFYRGTAYDTFFRSQHAPAYRRGLWEKSLKRYIESELYVRSNPISQMVNSVRVLNQRSVFITDSSFARMLVSFGCMFNSFNADRANQMMLLFSQPHSVQEMSETLGLSDEEKESELRSVRRNAASNSEVLHEIFMHSAVDPHEKQFSQGVVASSAKTKQLLSLLDAFTVANEFGITQKYLEMAESSDFAGKHPMAKQMVGGPLPSRQQKVRDCRSESIVSKDSQFQAIGLQNYEMLIKTYALLLLISFTVLLCEIGGTEKSIQKPKLRVQ